MFGWVMAMEIAMFERWLAMALRLLPALSKTTTGASVRGRTVGVCAVPSYRGNKGYDGEGAGSEKLSYAGKQSHAHSVHGTFILPLAVRADTNRATATTRTAAGCPHTAAPGQPR